MRSHILSYLPRCSTALCLLLALIPIQLQGDNIKLNWYKGNTHAHTMNTDADATPDQAVSWYRSHGYNFLVITDANQLTPVEGLNNIFGCPGKFLVLRGEEVIDQLNEKGVDVTAIDLRQPVQPNHGSSVHQILQNNINSVRQAGGIAQINHPNYNRAIAAQDLLGLNQVKLLEIYNAHPIVNSIGAGGIPSVEQLWDQVLTAGQVFYGVASDDTHKYQGEFSIQYPNPGRAWIMVQASELTLAGLRTALEKGDFYASTGVALDSIEITPAQLKIEIAGDPGMNYTTVFLGEGGRALASDFSLTPVYKFTGQEKYVRARIFDSKGALCWTQPVFHPGR